MKEIKNKKQISALALFVFFGFAELVNSQTPVTLQDAVDIALKNNRNLKNEKLKSEYTKALIRSSSDILRRESQ